MEAAILSPTTHTLPESQRRRLMRSARKLETLLGETPLLVQTQKPSAGPTSFSRGHSRSSSVNSATSSTSRLRTTASLRFGKRPATADAAPPRLPTSEIVPRPTLYLAVPDRKSTSTPLPSPSPSPLSASSSSLALENPTSTRRRRMAKLSRTLGEMVPAELVFPAPGRRRSSRRASMLGLPDFEHVGAVLDIGPGFIADDDEDASFPSTLPMPDIIEPMSRWSSSTESDSDSESYLQDHPALTTRWSRGDDRLFPNRARTISHNHNKTYRREQGWSGEWGGNVTNMDEVVRSLRGLKVK
ncbi:hypothetical protein R3P38DRAFT_2882708 [Favolaschia claudopus]|uniref:Uncharacterized protein n=1 Tax=Favolaschia claudopus TaxID=2862362 RepID=A0AAW0CYX7_9AGAR